MIGMAKPVADVDSAGENAAGFVSDSNMITGFSHLHDSGTGGNPSMGNFPLFVQPGCREDDFAQCTFQVLNRGVFRKYGTEAASPGYFGIGLNNSVHAEMTATQHTALYRFSIPGSDEVWDGTAMVPNSPLVLMDLIDLGQTRSQGGIQVYPDSGRIIGDGVYSPSFGIGQYSAFFCADFHGAQIRRTGTFMNLQAREEPKYLDSSGTGYSAMSGSAGAWIQFDKLPRNQLLARVGLSFISTDQACANAEAEIPTFDFDRTVKAAEDAWRRKLSVVEVDATGVSDSLQTTFWSGVYRTMLSPQNYTGENQLWDSDEPYFDSYVASGAFLVA